MPDEQERKTNIDERPNAANSADQAQPKQAEPKQAASSQAEPKQAGAAKNDSSARLREIRAIIRKYHVTRGITPEKLRQILVELGPTYVKLGQIMSPHSDILPKR